jgi:hypothetical protein
MKEDSIPAWPFFSSSKSDKVQQIKNFLAFLYHMTEALVISPGGFFV